MEHKFQMNKKLDDMNTSVCGISRTDLEHLLKKVPHIAPLRTDFIL